MIGAAHALACYEEIERVAIFDYDVHHGNGTASSATARHTSSGKGEPPKDVLYLSTHQHPFYPGTGEDLSSRVDGWYGVVNAPLGRGEGSAEFRAAVSDRILPSLRAFEPDLLILSSVRAPPLLPSARPHHTHTPPYNRACTHANHAPRSHPPGTRAVELTLLVVVRGSMATKLTRSRSFS